MKVGIVTINGLFNYGNRLQNFAVSEYLRSLGCDARTLVPQPYSYRYPMTNEEKEIEVKIENGEDLSSVNKNLLKRYNFKAFNEKYIPSDLIKKKKYDDEIVKKYDKFVTGSDQVLNPTFRSSLGQMENNLLMFAPPYKRATFAPSLGMEEIPEKFKGIFYDALTKFPMLSVREESAADIIEDLTGRRPKVVIDPTLMVDRARWEEVAKPLAGFDYDSPYILYYFLGDKYVEMPVELNTALNREKSQYKLREVVINDPQNEVVKTAGPAEFLDLFKNASLVVTDSFHGAVFSIIFGKPFVTVQRTVRTGNEEIDMSGRIKTLLKELGLERKLPKTNGFTHESIIEADYNECYGKLRLLQNEQAEFLKAALKVV